VFDEEAAKLTSDAKWLAQGTIYPDVIESAGSKTGKAHVIKSHHNVGGLPEHMKLKLVEPLRELFKDEVRRSASSSACRARWSTAIRSPARASACASSARCAANTPNCCARPTHLHRRTAQGRPLRQGQPGVRRVPAGEVGRRDGRRRRYDWVIALRAVETIDFMTAHWAHLPYDFLDHVSRAASSTRSSGVSRVVYDISGKPPATIEWEWCGLRYAGSARRGGGYGHRCAGQRRRQSSCQRDRWRAG
jgi:GMP synthase (glutamine-hydrolysing)